MNTGTEFRQINFFITLALWKTYIGCEYSGWSRRWEIRSCGGISPLHILWTAVNRGNLNEADYGEAPKGKISHSSLEEALTSLTVHSSPSCSTLHQPSVALERSARAAAPSRQPPAACPSSRTPRTLCGFDRHNTWWSGQQCHTTRRTSPGSIRDNSARQTVIDC